MNKLPGYLRRAVARAASDANITSQNLIGYVAPTCTAWAAEIDQDGQIVSEFATFCDRKHYDRWQSSMIEKLRQRGDGVRVFVLDDCASETQH